MLNEVWDSYYYYAILKCYLFYYIIFHAGITKWFGSSSLDADWMYLQLYYLEKYKRYIKSNRQAYNSTC